MSHGLWSATVEFNTTIYGFLKSSMLELLLTLKGPDLIHNMLLLLQKHTNIDEQKFTKDLQACIYLSYLIPR